MKLLQVLGLLLIFVVAPLSGAFAQLLITPLQVVMEGRDRSTTIVLVNNSNKTNTYRLSWEQYVQVDKLGGYAPIEEVDKYNVVLPEGYRDLKDFAVYTPRQITLGPNEKQTVRIAVRRPADLADGEYKSHLKFKVLPNTSPEDAAVYDPTLGKNEARFKANVNASFLIPVVYRVGDYNINVSLQQPSFNVNERTGLLNISVPVVRSGVHGVIGAVDAYFKPNGGDEELVGSVGNANLFPELTERTLVVPTKLNGLKPGVLRLVFKKAEGQVGDYVVLDEVSVPVRN